MRRTGWLALGAGFLGVASLLAAKAPERPTVDPFELSYFPSGRMIGTAALDFDGLAADLTFLRAVQYYGTHRRLDRSYPWAPHMFDVVTTLDPHFATPYLFGALVLAEDMRRLDLAMTLLDRGMAAMPERWELVFEAGFLLFVHDRGNTRAGELLERASLAPNVPDYVKRFAADAYRRSGSVADALRLWRDIAENTQEPGLREAARRYIAELEGSTSP